MSPMPPFSCMQGHALPGSGRACLWGAEQRHGRHHGENHWAGASESQDWDEDPCLQHPPTWSMAAHQSVPGMRTAGCGRGQCCQHSDWTSIRALLPDIQRCQVAAAQRNKPLRAQNVKNRGAHNCHVRVRLCAVLVAWNSGSKNKLLLLDNCPLHSRKLEAKSQPTDR